MSYPEIKDEQFYNKINTKFQKYKIPKKRKTFNEICFPKEFELQSQQKFLSKFMSPDTPYKGILVFHRIGAGKTCTAIVMAEQWKQLRKIIVVVPASLIGNFRGELRSQCAGDSYISNKDREKLKVLHPSSDEYKEIIKKSDAKIDKFYQIYSYNKFVELAEHNEINLRNSVLIIDEIQNMVSEHGKYYKVLYNLIHNAPKELRTILLSATPMFDKPVEIALTMNLLRIPHEFPTGSDFEKIFIKIMINKKTGQYYYKAKNLEEFKKRIKGYVSYFRGAPPYVFPETSIKYVKCEMSDFQYKSYITVLKKEQSVVNFENLRKTRAFRVGEILNLPNNFFIGTRIISNIAFPNKDINEDGFNSFKGKHLQMENLQNYSIKFYKIINKINKCSGPVYVYSSFKEYGGIKSLVKALEAQGYKDYVQYGEGRKRFAIMSGDESRELKDEIKAVYNQIDNANGSKLKVLFLTPAIREGHSFKNVRQAHILEPYWNISRLLQVIGRSVRYCSHKDLPEEKRNVKVFIYLSTHPEEKETIDQYISKLAIHKNNLIGEFELALKESAVDCDIFKNANVYQGENDIKCVI